MTEFYIDRFCLAEKFTLAALRIGAAFPEFFTLEDPVREIPGEPAEQWKVPRMTAIGVGRYPLIIDQSVRFKREMPHILNVPGFDGIRLHSGNVITDTEGCPLLGYSASILAGTVSQSVAAAYSFYDRLRLLLKQGEVYINIRNP